MSYGREDAAETARWEADKLPEVTEVERLTLKPGDRIVIRADQVLTAREAHELTQMARVRLQLPEDAPVFVLGRGMSLEVVEGL